MTRTYTVPYITTYNKVTEELEDEIEIDWLNLRQVTNLIEAVPATKSLDLGLAYPVDEKLAKALCPETYTGLVKIMPKYSMFLEFLCLTSTEFAIKRLERLYSETADKEIKGIIDILKEK
jgi:hypothetical protein